MKVLITGGAGFIGTNLAAALHQDGAAVTVLDNLSRAGVEANAVWLQRECPGMTLLREDIRDTDATERAMRGVDRVYHLAGQVAVTTSVTDPRSDCEINLLGTVNVLEGARAQQHPPAVFFTSTNKVYGGMEDAGVVERNGRYEYADLPHGVGENTPLDFHSPYGCSKGAADQYVRDYSRIYGFPTVVFRMSCIYGPHQCGNEDQGWVAHFARQALEGGSLSIFGDGKQVRDILYVGDLVRAFVAAGDQISRTSGRVYNIGGGPSNTVSLLELIAELERQCAVRIPVSFHDWRPGDQRIYVTDVRKAAAEFGWSPAVSRWDGVARLVNWLRTSRAA